MIYNQYYDNNECYDFIKFFEKNITESLIRMVDNVEIKNNNERPKWNKINVNKSHYDKYTIEKFVSFELTYKEIPSRSIILGNIPTGTTEEDLDYLVKLFGDYQEMDIKDLKNGKVIIRFYDLRDAMIMRTSVINIETRRIIISFGNDLNVIDKKNPPNNGTIVVFNLPENVINADVLSNFNSFGDIRDIRKTPNKKSQRFIEFYDSRSAQKARNDMKKKKLRIANYLCKINVEFSLPGNYRVNSEKYYNHNIPTIQRRTVTISN